MPVECMDIGTDIRKFADITKEEAEEIAQKMASENMRKMMTIHQDIFNDAHGNIKRAQKRQKKYYDIRHATAEVLSIGDIVVKERQANVSRKGRRLAKKREDYFFVVEEILKNGNIVLRDWNKNEIADKSVPPQQLKKIHMNEMRMDDFENSFKRCKIEESSGQTENMTSSDAESISLTTSLTTTMTTNPITVLTYGMDNGREDAQTISLTTTPTTTQTTILTDTEELVLGTNVYMTSTLTSSPNNNKQEEYGESSLTATTITNENELKCENVFTNTKMTSSGNTMEVFTITNMTDSLITIMIPSFN